MRLKNNIITVIYHIFVFIFAAIMVYPVIWMFFGSFKTNFEILNNQIALLPEVFSLNNYIVGWKGFGGISFSVFFKNAFFVCIVATVGVLISSSLVAYGFARCKFPLKDFWFGCLLLSMMVPFQILMIPQYILFNKLGMVGTYLPMILPQWCAQGFFVFLNVQFIKGIPAALDEAAMIDGAGPLKIFGYIVLPLIKPSLVTCAIFSFMWRWDDFLAALLYLNEPHKYTVSLALKLFTDPTTGSDWGAIFAMATLSLLPIFLIFVTMQKYLVEGIAATGIKG